VGFSWSEPIKQTLSHDQTTPHGLSGGLTEWLRWIDSCRATSAATPACLTLFGQRPGVGGQNSFAPRRRNHPRKFAPNFRMYDLACGLCPLYPQKRTLISTAVMSALCQKRTLARYGSSPRAEAIQEVVKLE
jgi:hypothetical protein